MSAFGHLGAMKKQEQNITMNKLIRQKQSTKEKVSEKQITKSCNI